LSTFGTFLTKSLLSSADTWSSQLIVDAVSSGIEAVKAAEKILSWKSVYL